MADDANNEPQEVPLINRADAEILIKIIEKALEFRPLIQKAVLGPELQALSQEEQFAETLRKRVAYHYMGKLPTIFLRFVGNESPIIEALFYPIEATHAFLEAGREWVRTWEMSEAEKEDLAFLYAVEMLLILLDNFYPRAELMMESFTEEVWQQWAYHKVQSFAQYQAEQGLPVQKPKRTGIIDELNNYAKELRKLWHYQEKTNGHWRKMWLAEEYESLFRHWRKLYKEYPTNDDWQEYAKAGKFSDTPDDLLRKLEFIDRSDEKTTKAKISELALEHAARRARLIKKHGVPEEIMAKRRAGVQISGYSNAQLHGFLKEGREWLAIRKANKAFLEQEVTNASPKQLEGSAPVKNVKLLEQIAKPALAESVEPVAQNGNSALIEKIEK